MPWYKRVWATVREYWLEGLLFAIATGNAEVLRAYLLSTGSADVWQLTIAVYATELLVCTVGMWGIPGLVMALVLFLTSLWSINHQYGAQAIGHSYFSVAIFTGTVANYVRRRGTVVRLKKELGAEFTDKGVLDTKELTGMSVAGLRDRFGLSHRRAKEMQESIRSGRPISESWIRENRKAV